MSKNNYTNFFNKNQQNNIKEESVDENKSVDLAGPASPLDSDNINNESDNITINETSIESKMVSNKVDNKNDIRKGNVYNCNRLYVRRKPDVESKHISIIKKDDEVEIDLKMSTQDFYKVKINNINGYCMKKYIKIK